MTPCRQEQKPLYVGRPPATIQLCRALEPIDQSEFRGPDMKGGLATPKAIECKASEDSCVLSA
eukprot:SAG11_NODE_2117_length_3792_cov_2.955321_5_plen_63_part_00